MNVTIMSCILTFGNNLFTIYIMHKFSSAPKFFQVGGQKFTK